MVLGSVDIVLVTKNAVKRISTKILRSHLKVLSDSDSAKALVWGQCIERTR